MFYGSFAKWYLAKLRAKPYLVNVGSGLVLMSTGDVIAQKVEIPDGEGSSEDQSLKLKNVKDVVHQNLMDEIAFWDKSRTLKMAAWSLFFTPFYVGIYKCYDRFLPKKNIPSIAARVGLSFLASIPINFAFYGYGNFVQHTADWYTEKQQSQSSKSVPYRFEQLVAKTQRKLEAELVNTIRTSALFWIPTNMISFTFVPSHIQPLALMVLNIFWNSFLSMSQHRRINNEHDSTDPAAPAKQPGTN